MQLTEYVSFEKTTTFMPKLVEIPNDMCYFKFMRADQNIIWEAYFLKHCSPVLTNFANFLIDYHMQANYRRAKDLRKFEK